MLFHVGSEVPDRLRHPQEEHTSGPYPVADGGLQQQQAEAKTQTITRVLPPIMALRGTIQSRFTNPREPADRNASPTGKQIWCSSRRRLGIRVSA